MLMNTKTFNKQLLLKIFIATALILIFDSCILINRSHVAAQAPEWMDPEVISAFEQAMITPQDMPQSCLWVWGEDQGSNGELTGCDWHFTQANVSSLVTYYNPYWTNTGEYRFKAHNQGGGSESVMVSIQYDDKDLDEFIYGMENLDDNFKYPAIPNAYIYHFTKSETNFEWVRIRFWVSRRINVDVEVWLYNSVAKSEAERLAQLLYSRLSAYGDSPGTTPAQPDSNIGVPDDNQSTLIPDYVPPPGSIDFIPDGALPLAAGASALIVALGALGAASASGVPPHEAIRELLELLRGRQSSPTGGRSPEEILANPRLHDKIVDVNGKHWVYYKPAGDQASTPFWVSKEDYDHEMKQLKSGRAWDSTHGWADDKERAEQERNREIFDRGDLKDREKLRENILKDQEENNRRMQAEIDRRNAIMNKRSELAELELQSESDQKAVNLFYIDALRGTSREILTGIGKKWDPESGQYVDSISWSATALRIIAGATSGGASEKFFLPGSGAYGLNDRLENGETLFHAVMGTANDLSKQFLIGKGIQGATPYLSYGANKVSKVIYKPRSLPFGKGATQGAGAIKPGPISSELLAKKNAIGEALKIKDPVKQAEAIRNLYKNGGIKDMHALEKSGHLTAGQANRINQAITKEVNSTIQEATNKTLKDFRVATKNGIEVKVDGVKVKEVMLGDSGSSSGKNIIAGKGRSIATDNDRTIQAVFDKKQLSAYAKKNGMSVEAAQQKLNDQLVKTHNHHTNQAFQKKGLALDDVDYKAYSGMGSKAGPADSYPEGYTAARQAVQGKTEVYSVNSKGHVSSYKTSGERLTDQTALEKFGQTGNRKILESGGPKIAGSAEGRMLLKEQIPNLESNSLNKIAKGVERADKGLALIRSSNRVPKDILALANHVRNNPQAVHSLAPWQQQQLLDYGPELAKLLQ